MTVLYIFLGNYPFSDCGRRGLAPDLRPPLASLPSLAGLDG